MRFLSLFVVLASTVFLSTSIGQQAGGERPFSKSRLPDRTALMQYIENLIDTYNDFVNKSDRFRPDFNAIRGFLSLYHEAGSSFEVIAIETYADPTPSQPYQTNPINLIFIRIQAAVLDLVMDNNDTFWTLFPNATLTMAQVVILPNLPFRYNGTLMRPDLVLGIDAGLEITPDYMTNSYQAALDIYDHDHKLVPTVSQTQTTTQTVSEIQTATSQNATPSWNLWDYFVAITTIVGLPASLLYLWKERRYIRSLWHSSHKKSKHSKQGTETNNKQEQ